MYYVFNHTITLLSIPYTEKNGINKTSSAPRIYIKKTFQRQQWRIFNKKGTLFFGILPTLAVLLLSFPLTGRLGEKKKSECVCEFFFNITMAAYLSAVLAVNGQGLKTPVSNHGGRYHPLKVCRVLKCCNLCRVVGCCCGYSGGASLRLPLPKVFVPLRGQPVCRMMA